MTVPFLLGEAAPANSSGARSKAKVLEGKTARRERWHWPTRNKQGLPRASLSLHSPGPTQPLPPTPPPSPLANYHLRLVLSATFSFMFFSVYLSCNASPSKVSLFCPSEGGFRSPCHTAVSLSVPTPQSPPLLSSRRTAQ